jgi:spermidine synthase
VVFPSTDFLVHLVLTEDLGQLFGTGPLHTDDRPLLEFAAPRTLYSGTLDIDQAAADRRRFTTATRSLREARSDPDTLLDLVAFSASANVPMFNVLFLAALDPSQKERYREIVSDYCRRVLVPAYSVFGDEDLKTCCAGTQAEAIARQLQTGEPRAMDHYNLGVALTAAGRSAEAGEHLQTALDLEPDHASARMALGLLLAADGDLDQAARHLARAVELAPRNPEALKFLGMVELRRGASGPAVTALSTSLVLSPDDPEIQAELGIALLQQGRHREAHVQLTKALRQWPRDDESRSYLELARRQAAEPGKETPP